MEIILTLRKKGNLQRYIEISLCFKNSNHTVSCDKRESVSTFLNYIIRTSQHKAILSSEQ